MQINLSCNRHNYHICSKPEKVSFSGQRICRVPLKIGNVGEHIKDSLGWFTKLDESDIETLQRIRGVWWDTRFGEDIISDALSKLKQQRDFGVCTKISEAAKSDYFMVECPDYLKSVDRVRALASVRYDEDLIMVGFVQSASNINLQQKVRGAGSGLFYGLTKFAEENNFKFIDLESATLATDRWYKRLGFTRNFGGLFYLEKANFAALRKNIEEKILKLGKKSNEC